MQRQRDGRKQPSRNPAHACGAEKKKVGRKLFCARDQHESKTLAQRSSPPRRRASEPGSPIQASVWAGSAGHLGSSLHLVHLEFDISGRQSSTRY